MAADVFIIFFFQAEDGIRDKLVTGVQTCALPISVPSQVDFRSFKVGENLAVTPGDVVMQHEMFELIQYAPQTEQVWHRPILFVPSIINKYYAFDLAPGRSLFEFLVKNGFTLFSMVCRAGRARSLRRAWL